MAENSYRKAKAALDKFLEPLTQLKTSLDEATEVETFLSEAAGKLGQVQAQIKAAEETTKYWSNEITERRAEHQAVVDELAAGLVKKRQEFQDQMDAAFAEKEKKIAEFAGDVKKLQEDHRSLLAQMAEARKARQAELDAVTTKLNETTAQFDKLRERLHAVVGA